MAVGIPVIGSRMAGSAADRIEHGVNGWLYDCEDVVALANWIRKAHHNRAGLRTMGDAAYATARANGPNLAASRLQLELSRSSEKTND